MAQVPSGLISHSRKVCNFYKRVIRHLDSLCEKHLDEFRYRAVLMRDRFDKNKDIKDLRVAKQLLQQGEEELLRNLHYSYKVHANSVGGCAYGREARPLDTLLDYWHPMEKAMYPKYFATREKRKIEYEEFYRQQYGEPQKKSDHH